MLEYDNAYQIAKDYLKEHKDGQNMSEKEVSARILKYISNCFEVLGAKLSSLNEIRKVRSLKIDEDLRKHIIKIMKEEMTSFPNKATLRHDIETKAFGYGSYTFNPVFVVKHIVKENFTDAVYKEKTDFLRNKILQINEMFIELTKEFSGYGNLSDGLFFITKRNIFNEIELQLYFSEVERCYKEYSLGDDTRLNEHDITLINFLSLKEKLKQIEKELSIEIIKHICS